MKPEQLNADTQNSEYQDSENNDRNEIRAADGKDLNSSEKTDNSGQIPEDDSKQKSEQNPESVKPETKNKEKESETADSPDCQIVGDLLPLYIEGLASPASRRLVEDHIERCSSCKSRLEDLKEEPQVSPPDAPVESALHQTGKTLKKHRTALITLGIVCVLLIGLTGSIFWSKTEMNASEVRIARVSGSGDQKTMVLEPTARGTGFFSYKLSAAGAGRAALSVRGGSGLFDQKSSLEIPIPEGIDQIDLGEDILYQDGLPISSLCRYYYSYANGYAGDVMQMELSRPNLPSDEDITFYMAADTDDPENCAWTWVMEDQPLSRFPQTYRKEWTDKALLAIALTPNLQEVRLQGVDGTDVLASRDMLSDLLREHKVSTVINSISDLQKILNILYPAG